MKHLIILAFFLLSVSTKAQTNSSSEVLKGGYFSVGVIYVEMKQDSDKAENLAIPVSGLSYYPNPVKDYVTFLTDIEIKEVVVYDMSGRIVIQTVADNNKINLSPLPKGTYIIKTSGEIEGSYKIIKE
ncbi:T9SS type A sorting domain-containing protein [Flavobacterium microcysteis]|uniref:T9SS type A sorting domain-containing protein n=1 Tax=Flavobacterium microcysteis TaxID=2596891 RepID=A0A501QFF1_9FLAO|nr:T9SS type A sorting domain-containing protein [Flavobacterium microcysteis]TPD71102.1 T9SS type A sorting domain-containing protein [Flavobacterium microcysteis]